MQIRGLDNFLQIASAIPAAVPEGDLQLSRPCRVLVVDDDELVRASLTTMLRAREFDVESAASGEDALRVMAATPCQILLTDWQMPGMDGLSLCQSVRDNGPDRYVYVLLHTVRDGEEALLAGLAAGADDYVVKGAPVAELLARLEVGRRVTGYPAWKPRRDKKWRSSFADPLTGARNLRYLVRHLPRELARSLRDGHALAILGCAVDGFKHINDRFGVEVGRDVLHAFVGQAERCLRPGSDWLARVAADEFMIVLPEANVHRAHGIAQTMREAFVRDGAATGAGPVSFTVSIGMTAIEPKYRGKDLPKLEDILRAAERGLRASKQCGGNHVTAAAVSSRIAIDVGSLSDGNCAIH